MNCPPSFHIPLLDLAPEIESLLDELQAASTRVLRSCRFILGPEVENFESEAADYLGVKHAIGVNSGTDALTIALRALNIGAGDEVITTPFTFVATAEAICSVGAVPVFVDIDARTLNIDPNQIESAVTPRTKAILPVHLFGLACEMDAIADVARRRGLLIVEDAAQAFGGRYREAMLGALGDIGAFSFFPSKNLGAFGDGGLVATNRDDVADTCRKLRNHGGRDKYRAETLGYNSRLDELQAAILRVKLPHLDRWNDNRREVARLYDEKMKGISWLSTPHEPENCHHVYHQYTVQITSQARDDAADHLANEGISTGIYYRLPLHRVPVFQAARHNCPAADECARRVLSLPMSPSLKEAAIDRIVSVTQKVG